MGGGFTCVVGGLPWYADQRDLDGFIRFGDITSAKIMRDEKNFPMGYGLVTFSSERGMRKAIEKMNGKPLPDTGYEVHLLDVFEATPGRDSWSWDTRECERCGLPGHCKKDCNSIPPTDPKHVFAGELKPHPFRPEVMRYTLTREDWPWEPPAPDYTQREWRQVRRTYWNMTVAVDPNRLRKSVLEAFDRYGPWEFFHDPMDRADGSLRPVPRIIRPTFVF
ncbi:hypothetical protein SELMODRAFT_411846 [Selaginella moellendorffii]|uniref:CCHC-type domain-containing protein n=1 Tax=Selaginella moellendorffii TaxID=88036 RepID=D8RJ79_SELML|nr:hypothetical protein SELMODRAFT_411846 [Selaginella moellendorffii]